MSFPSPANDYLENTIDLNQYLIKNPLATALVKVNNQSMLGAGIAKGAILLVDTGIKPQHNQIVIAEFDGELMCRRLNLNPCVLVPENDEYPQIHVHDSDIKGVVTTIINTDFSKLNGKNIYSSFKLK
jgi:DNA polymerase V